jgi:hypothetical protein
LLKLTSSKRLFSGLRPVGPEREHYHQMGHHVVDA